jgi:amino acid transporter
MGPPEGDAMTAVAAQPGAHHTDQGPRTGVLKVRHAVITSLAVITPAAAILFLPIPIAANAGAAMPLSIVVAFAVVLVIMNAVYRFTQRISHAGSFFAFVRDSLGVRAGFVAGWLFLAFYPVFVGLDLNLFGADHRRGRRSRGARSPGRLGGCPTCRIR